MPLALKPSVKIQRARALLAECRALTEPPMGQAHGHWKVKLRSRLSRAARLIERKSYRRRDDFAADERATADALLKEIDALWPR